MILQLKPLVALPLLLALAIQPNIAAQKAPISSLNTVATFFSVPNNLIELKVNEKPIPNFDKEVLEPLRASQKAEADAEAAQAAKVAQIAAQQAYEAQETQVQVVSAVSVSYSGTLSSWLLALRTCESGGNYSENTGNGYYGAYQFSITTWNSWNTGYARADLAPPSVQDSIIIKNTLSSGLANQNPGCYRSQGLSNFPPRA